MRHSLQSWIILALVLPMTAFAASDAPSLADDPSISPAARQLIDQLRTANANLTRQLEQASRDRDQLDVRVRELQGLLNRNSNAAPFQLAPSTPPNAYEYRFNGHTVYMVPLMSGAPLAPANPANKP